MNEGKEPGAVPDPADERRMIDQNLVRAVANPLRVRILEALQGRAASPAGVTRELRSDLGSVSYHVTKLLEVDAIEGVRTGRVRGAIEHFYIARPRSFIGHQDWRHVPLSVRSGVTAEALRTFISRACAAIDADTIDTRDDATLHWMAISVDEQGWQETAQILGRALSEVTAVAAASRERLDGADGIPVVTGLAAFEAPPGGNLT
jgi:Helix-turn-helix domain